MPARPIEEIVKLLTKTKHASDDPDTQVACIIVTASGEVIRAANQLASGITPYAPRLVRPEKYSWIGHAEQRAIALAARNGFSTRNATLYLSWFPCAVCAVSIINAGITTVNANTHAYEVRKASPSYGFAASMEMLKEVRVKIEWH